MFELLIIMIERIGIIVTIAFVVTRFQFFRTMLNQNKLSVIQYIQAIILFGLLGMIGTYTGITVNTESLSIDRWMLNVTIEEAIANSRVVGVVMAGLFGGWRLGLGAGLIAGIHRYSLGGFTGLACGMATVIAGLLASIFHKKNNQVSFAAALLMGALAEALQMLIILLVSRPFEQALHLVTYIGVPMIVANGIGCALFLLIIKSVLNEEEKVAALQSQKSLRIARKTLEFMRQGMNPQSAEAVCQILYEEVRASAISMTDDKTILAYIGKGEDHHTANLPLQTEVTRSVIETGELLIVERDQIHCQVPDCPLGSAIIGPLKQGDQTVGTLKFYFRSSKDINHVTVELMTGLTMLLSYQLEAAQLEEAKGLAREAEIKTLQSQIQPHFLFNSLNTILSLIRIDPDKARVLLRSLSDFIRLNLTAATSERTTLKEELKHVKSYLGIEEIRFEDKLRVFYEVEEGALGCPIPPLTLQPLVENCIRHAFKDKINNCEIHIQIKQAASSEVAISIKDNGMGISSDRLQLLGHQMLDSPSGTGLAVYNVNRRLILMYGEKAALQIQSEKDHGTKVSFCITSKTEFHTDIESRD